MSGSDGHKVRAQLLDESREILTGCGAASLSFTKRALRLEEMTFLPLRSSRRVSRLGGRAWPARSQ